MWGTSLRLRVVIFLLIGLGSIFLLHADFELKKADHKTANAEAVAHSSFIEERRWLTHSKTQKSDIYPVRDFNRSQRCSFLLDKNGNARKVVTLVFVDAHFVDIFLNFLAHYRETCGRESESQLEVICMGHMEQYAQILSYYGVKCSSSSFFNNNLLSDTLQKKLSSIWLHRLKIVLQYLSNGVDVLLTDTDALWLQDPFPYLQQYSMHSEIVAQKGFAPWELSERWGACLCFGFIYLKASPFTVDLFQSMDSTLERKLRVEPKDFQVNDQHAINNQLAAWKVRWPGSMLMDGERADTGLVTRNDSSFNITLLPHSRFVRYCLKTGEDWAENTEEQHKYVASRLSSAVVAHCQIASGSGASKHVFMRLHHLWKHTYEGFRGVLTDKLKLALNDTFFLKEVMNYQRDYGEAFEEVVRKYGDLHARLGEESIKVAHLHDGQKLLLLKQAVIAAGGNWTGTGNQSLGGYRSQYSRHTSEERLIRNADTLVRLRETLAKNKAAHEQIRKEWERRQAAKHRTSTAGSGPTVVLTKSVPKQQSTADRAKTPKSTTMPSRPLNAGSS